MRWTERVSRKKLPKESEEGGWEIKYVDLTPAEYFDEKESTRLEAVRRKLGLSPDDEVELGAIVPHSMGRAGVQAVRVRRVGTS